MSRPPRSSPDLDPVGSPPASRTNSLSERLKADTFPADRMPADRIHKAAAGGRRPPRTLNPAKGLPPKAAPLTKLRPDAGRTSPLTAPSPRTEPDLPVLPHLPREVAEQLQAFASHRAAPRTADVRPASNDVSHGASPVAIPTEEAEPSRNDQQPAPPKPAPFELPPPAARRASASPMSDTPSGRKEIVSAIRDSHDAFIGIGILSLLINVLMLTGPLFMLQVYDRVLGSGSLPTLWVLLGLTVLLYSMCGFFELVRSRIVARASVEIDQRLSDRIFRASLRKSLVNRGASISALRDLDTVRQFASGPAPMTFFDAPWTPIYLAVIFLVHWALGFAALAGAAIIVGITIYSERTAREPLSEANRAAQRSLEMADSAQRNIEALAAMGMIEAYRRRWQQLSGASLAWQIQAADRIGTATAYSRSLRLLLQSLMLAVGAALAIGGDISSGSIIAGTIIFGRALAPIEHAVAQWKSFVKAREAFGKLAQLLDEQPLPAPRTALPKPKGLIAVSQLRVAVPESRKLILANLNFTVNPGEVCAVIGPSASGKSTLARTLVGLWPAASGSITIDGADLQQWEAEALGRHIGYLPQDVELFAGTVRDNICRFAEDASDAAVIEAAQMAYAHEMILGLPQGYDTQLGAFGAYLSAGQRQRIGLARALFGNPALIVLDEPNANLDRIGDEALAAALASMKARGQAVMLISHRVQAMGVADMLLYIDRGVQRAFGPRDEVMKMFRAGGHTAGGAASAASAAPASGAPMQPQHVRSAAGAASR